MPAETDVEQGPLDRPEVLQLVRDRLADILEIDPTGITEAASFADDLEADSLDLVEFVMALEERFDISVPEEDLEGVETVGHALTLVLDKLATHA